MTSAFAHVKRSGLALACLIVACTSDAPTEAGKNPPASGPPTVSRRWQFFAADRNANWTQIGNDRTLDDGVADDSVVFGTLALHPRALGPTAEAAVFSNETGQTYWAFVDAPHLHLPATNTSTGATALLYQESRYVIDSDAPSLSYTLSHLVLDAIDADPSAPTPAQCRQSPPGDRFHCPSIRTLARFRLVARDGTRELLSVQGSVRVQGHSGAWDFDVWTEDGDAPAFTRNDFLFDPDGDDSETFSFAHVELDAQGGTQGFSNPITYRVPFAGTKRGDTIVVNAAVTVSGLDSRQEETYAGAFLRDPASPAGVAVLTSGVHLIAPPRPPTAEEIKGTPRSAPACTASPGSGGTLQFSATAFNTAEGEFPGALVEVTRSGSTVGVVSAVVSTTGGSATLGDDFDAVSAVVRFGDGQGGSRMVAIPIHGDATEEPDETIALTLANAGGCATLGASTATLTIHDDDTPPPPPPAHFSIGGTVTGLAGSGLVLHDRLSGFETRPTTDGSFTIVPASVDGAGYDIVVATQPSNPLQVCTIVNGSGTVASTNVSNVAVTCVTPAPTGALDVTFGSGGRATSVLTGGATALALQADGKIIVGGESRIQRFNANGTLDASFGTAGGTDFVFSNTLGNVPQAIAIQSDGRIVVVGFITGLTRTDFVVARYNSDGTPDATFASGGKTIVDFGAISARGTAVALQGGAIVVAGQATIGTVTVSDADFAVARLTSAGAFDPSFGTGGKTTINVAGKFDGANAMAIQADGRIVLAGHAAVDGGSNGNIGLVRLTASGTPDATFGTNGVVSSTLGFGDVTREAFDLAIQQNG
jgi:uncharacterized delta-60 repeat protein